MDQAKRALSESQAPTEVEVVGTAAQQASIRAFNEALKRYGSVTRAPSATPDSPQRQLFQADAASPDAKKTVAGGSPGGDQSAALRAKLEASLTTAGFSGFNYSGASITAQLDGAAAAPIGATVVRLKADAAFARTQNVLAMQHMMLLAGTGLRAEIDKRVQEFVNSLAGYTLAENAQKHMKDASVTDKPADATLGSFAVWFATKSSGQCNS